VIKPFSRGGVGKHTRTAPNNSNLEQHACQDLLARVARVTITEAISFWIS